jgi:phage terminase small subunit
MAFTVKQRAFVEAYCGNATEAALQAGYSPKTAAFIGAENLKKPKIAAALKEREDKRLASLIATREERQRFWTSMMRDEDRKEADRLKASELLAKSEGDFLERREITGPNGAPIHPPEIKVIFSDEAD